MKKFYAGFFLWLLLSAVLGSWRPGVNRNFLRGDIVAYVQSDAAVDYLIPQNLEELEAGCTDIVQGVFRGTGTRQANQHIMAESDFTVEDGAGNVILGALEFPDRTVTVSSLQITKVLSGPDRPFPWAKNIIGKKRTEKKRFTITSIICPAPQDGNICFS